LPCLRRSTGHPNLPVFPPRRSSDLNIDLDQCRRRGVTVTNPPDVLTAATADHAFALLLATARRLREGDELVRSGTWTGWEPLQLDRKSTRLNSSHVKSSYAVFCL